MPTPRFHPFIRLIIFSAGAIIAMLVAGGAVVAVSMLMPNLISLANLASMTIAVTLLSYPLILLWMWFCRSTMDFRSFVSLGLRRAYAGRDCLAGVLCGAAGIAFLFGVLLLTGFAHLGAATGQMWSSETLNAGVPAIAQRLLLWAAVFVAVGFVEELVFRGYAFHTLTAWMGVVGATIVQAVVFALVHLQNVTAPGAGEGAMTATAGVLVDGLRALPGLFLIAVFFSLCYLKTGSLWFPIGFHAAWNFFLGCIFSLPVSGIPVPRLLDVSVNGSTWITGGTFGPEGSILLLPIIAAMSFVLLRQPNHPQAELDLALIQPPKPVVEFEEDEPHTSRFKTTMRSRIQTLEPEIADTLRQLSEARAARRQESLIAPAMPPEVNAGVLQSAPVAETTRPNNTQTPQVAVEPSVPTTELPRSTPQPVQPEREPEIVVPKPRVTATSDVAPRQEVAPPPAQPVPPAQPKKPPAPRW